MLAHTAEDVPAFYAGTSCVGTRASAVPLAVPVAMITHVPPVEVFKNSTVTSIPFKFTSYASL